MEKPSLTERILPRKYLSKRLQNYLNFYWAVPLVLVMRSVKPIVHIKICKIYSERLGHFVQDVAEQLVRKDQIPENIKVMYYFGEISNSQWATMVRRTMRIKGNWLRHLDFWNRVIPGGAEFQHPSSFTESRDIHGLLQSFDARLQFTESENLQALNWMQSRGMQENDKYICLQVRDNSYLRVYNPQKINTEIIEKDNFRNSDIADYYEAIQTLTSAGYWVIRMGKIVDSPIYPPIPRVIDYPFDLDRSDLLDIWLFANCDACISTISGPDYIPTVYRKPLLHVNSLPLPGLHAYLPCMTVPKNLFHKSTNKEFTLKDYLACNLTQSEEYETAGVQIMSLTSSELVEAFEEFLELYLLRSRHPIVNETLQSRFWQEFERGSFYSQYQQYRHQDARICSAWLRSRKDGFFAEEVE